MSEADKLTTAKDEALHNLEAENSRLRRKFDEQEKFFQTDEEALLAREHDKEEKMAMEIRVLRHDKEMVEKQLLRTRAQLHTTSEELVKATQVGTELEVSASCIGVAQSVTSRTLLVDGTDSPNRRSISAQAAGTGCTGCCKF